MSHTFIFLAQTMREYSTMWSESDYQNSGMKHDPPEIYGEAVEKYNNVKHPETLPSMDFEDLIEKIVNAEINRCVRFESAEGGHFVRQIGDDLITAVYAGPHGPENKPARIDQTNLKRLFEHSERIDLIAVDESPFSSIEISSAAPPKNS